MTVDIRDFIAARLDEREAKARRAIEASGGEVWRASDGGLYPEDNPSQHPGPFLADVYGFTDPGYGDHIASHDPAWALRDVKAKRGILEAFEDAEHEWGQAQRGARPQPVSYDVARIRGATRELAEKVLCRLAAPYADHPNFKLARQDAERAAALAAAATDWEAVCDRLAGDAPALAALAIHKPSSWAGWLSCAHCREGDESDPVEWPCETFTAIKEA